jgi:alkyl sulfatase BDS1-like metallo-beta-lactamase superfamily hydrolase
LLSALSTETLFDYLAIRLDPAKAAGRHWRFEWHFEDTGETVTQNLENATLTQAVGPACGGVDATIVARRPVLETAVLRPRALAEAIASGSCRVDGDVAKLTALVDMLDEFALMFDIVTPSHTVEG